MSRIYCDANTVIPVFVQEASSSRIGAWISDPALMPVLSDLVVLEFSSTVSRLVRERKIEATQAGAILISFRDGRQPFGRPLAITRRVFADARAIVERSHLGVRGPDALHLALVTATGLPFATFDARLRAAAQTLGLAVVEPPHL